VRIPKGLTAIEAAALPCAGITAYQALIEKLNIQAGQTILVQGSTVVWAASPFRLLPN
jgi:NADPH:quinone reductase-like Zn-dependent oxidoreductase